MLGIESTHLKIIAEHSCKRKTQQWSKFHVRLQLKIMLGLTKCEWQVWFKDCSLNFSSFYTELTGSGTGGQWFMYHSLHHNSSTNLWAIHNCKYLEEDSFRACEAPPPESQEFSELWVNDTSLFPCICKKKPRALEWNPWEIFRKHESDRMQSSAGRWIVWNRRLKI